MAHTTPKFNLEETILEMVRSEVARVLGTIAGPQYATTREAWPPGCRNNRMARERIRVVPGAVRTGTGKATVWSCTAAAYQAHHARPVVRLVPAAVSSSDEEIATRALSAAGLRSTTRKIA